MIEDLNYMIRDCRECAAIKAESEDLAGRKFRHEFGWGPTGKIMFVGQCPAFSNYDGKQGNSGFDKFFLGLLEEVGIDTNDFYFTNLIKIPVEISRISEETLDHCATHVKDEIAEVHPEFVFCLGKVAYQTMKRSGTPVFSVRHPGAIRYGNVTRDQWIEEFKALLTKVNYRKE